MQVSTGIKRKMLQFDERNGIPGPGGEIELVILYLTTILCIFIKKSLAAAIV